MTEAPRQLRPTPVFTIEDNGRTVWLHCSQCKIKLRTIKNDEEVRVDQGHYCSVCDPGFVVRNRPNGSETN